MIFVLPTSYLSHDQLKKIEQRAVSATLCKGGFVPTFSRKVMFGPQRYSCIVMRPLIIEQLIEQVKAVLKHLSCSGKNHDMITIMISWAQVATGMSFQLLVSPDLLVPQIECAWWQSIHTGLTSINTRIETSMCFAQARRQVEDRHIMDGICQCKNLSPIQIRCE
jgi:hypothetical protein